MRILLVHNFYRSKATGGEDIVFMSEQTALQEYIGEECVFEYLEYSDRINVYNILFNVFFSIRHFFGVYRFIKKHRIDLIHCHNYFPLLSFSIFLASKLAGAKSILTLHNYRLWCPSGILFRNGKVCHDCLTHIFPYPSIIHACYHNSRMESFITATAIFCYRQLIGLKRINKIIVLTNFQKDFMINNGLIATNQIVVKPNFFEAKPLQYLPFDKKEYDIVFVGRLEEEKGVMLLIDLIERLGDTYNWLVIGGGTLKKKVEYVAKKKNVLFVERVPNSIIGDYLRKSKYLIQLSILYETFGLTMVEAMSVGTPVIGYSIGTRTELIKDGVNGFLTSTNSAESTIIKALNVCGDTYKQLSENCLNSIRKFEKEAVIMSQVDLYNRIINNCED